MATIVYVDGFNLYYGAMRGTPSDVNLASHLLLDAFRGACDTVVAISNDSDLRVPLRIAESELGLTAGLVNPHPASHRSRALQATFFKQLRVGAVRRSQFAEVLTDDVGTFRRPREW